MVNFKYKIYSTNKNNRVLKTHHIPWKKNIIEENKY